VNYQKWWSLHIPMCWLTMFVSQIPMIYIPCVFTHIRHIPWSAGPMVCPTSDRCLSVGDFVAHNCGRGGEDTDSSDAWTLKGRVVCRTYLDNRMLNLCIYIYTQIFVYLCLFIHWKNDSNRIYMRMLVCVNNVDVNWADVTTDRATIDGDSWQYPTCCFSATCIS
jgi:hypothetical protein